MADGNKNNLIKKLIKLQTNLNEFISEVDNLKDESKLLDEKVVEKMQSKIKDITRTNDEINDIKIDAKMMIENGLKKEIVPIVQNIVDPINKDIGNFINLYKEARKNYNLQETYVLLNRIMKKKYNRKLLEE
jgi:predicted nuclease with TOPRIM domain